MKRRELISLLDSAAAVWPLAARAQEPARPLVGFLRTASAASSAHLVNAFRQGLGEAGFVEGQNVAVEYRWTDDQYDRVAGMAADLVGRRVAVIVTTGIAVAAVKAATMAIPIVFLTGYDPVELREAEAAGRAIGRQILIVKAASEREFDAAFATIVQGGAGALLVGGSPVFINRRRQLVTLSARYALPAIYTTREYSEAGGLMSYGPSLTDAYRRAGNYSGRILKGEKPGDLPVELASKFDLVINLATAKGMASTFRRCCSRVLTR